MLGVLCLSRNGNQPLMWAHYADSHRGVMVEFDELASCFSRRRTAEDDLGYLRSVVYSGTRPSLSMEVLDGDKAFEVFALTKSEHWRYEEEVRLIWPLKEADKTLETTTGLLALIACPPEAIRSVTLGCKADDETLRRVREALLQNPAASHIEVRQARLDDTAFDLTYGPVAESRQATSR
jgi:hypothetical protein